MEILKTAMAGTLESSDAQVTVEPGDDTASSLSIESSVIHQFGKQIKATVLETLEPSGCQRRKGNRSGQGCSGLHLKGTC